MVGRRATSHNITAGATNATYTATYQARVQADLSIQLTGTMGSATQATWTMTARNLGPQTAQSVVVRDVLPALTFVSASSGCTYAPGPRTVTCTASQMASGAQLTYTFRSDGQQGRKFVDNTATISSATADPVSASNSSAFRADCRKPGRPLHLAALVDQLAQSLLASQQCHQAGQNQRQHGHQVRHHAPGQRGGGGTPSAPATEVTASSKVPT